LSKHTRAYAKFGALALGCLAAGAGASAIATAGASSPKSSSAKSARSGGRGGRRGRLLRRAVHGDVVVSTANGYATVTFDRGTVVSVSGRQLTLRDGRRSSTYKTVTLTIPADARVRDNHRTATLADVKPGQRAAVIQAPKRTLVIARTAP
jgi:hypothetical protein